MPPEPWKDRWLKLNFTVVGGPHHGIKIPPKHGHKDLALVIGPPWRKVAYRPHRFVAKQEELVITVFAPVLLNEGILQLFVNGFCNDWCDNKYMKDFDPLLGYFIHPNIPTVTLTTTIL
jgi:hypothetical protein